MRGEGISNPGAVAKASWANREVPKAVTPRRETRINPDQGLAGISPAENCVLVRGLQPESRRAMLV